MWRKYVDVGARVGDKVQGHNGYEWVTDTLTSFDIEIGSISAGMHNERIRLSDCEVWVEEDEVVENLTNMDLVEELSELNGFLAMADMSRVDVDKFNHCLLEEDVNMFYNEINDAIETFKYAVKNRYDDVFALLDERGVFE